MGRSLESLVENLYAAGDRFVNFKGMKRENTLSTTSSFASRAYPYEWVDSIEKLKFRGLPEREHVYSNLSQKNVTEEEYQHALKVYEALRRQTFEDYHKIYIQTDALVLADVSESFRKTCMESKKPDPANYISAPSQAWGAML